MPRTMVNITDDEIGAESSALDNDQHLFALWAVPEGEKPVMVFGIITTRDQLQRIANSMLRSIGCRAYIHRSKEMPHDPPFPEFQAAEATATVAAEIQEG